MKPISLEPVVPWSYTYYGPDPAAGVSYGCFKDEEEGFEIFSSGEKAFSPATGKPMTKVADSSHEEIQKLMSDATASACHQTLFCKACSTSIIATANLEGFEEVHCVSCGSLVEISPKQLKGKTMDMKLVKEKIKAKLEEVIQEKKAASVVAEEKKEEAPAEEAKAEEAAPAAEEKPAEAAEEYVSLDEILEAVGCEEEEKPAAEASEEAPAEEKVEDSKKEEKDAKEEFLDLDMVLSSIRRKERAERIAKARLDRERKERVISKLKARRLALAEEACEEKEAKAEEAPAVEEKPAAEAPAAEIEKKEPDMVAQENPVPAVEAPAAPAAEAMKFEPLASVAYFTEAKKEEIDMALYGENSENPTWNVTVAGVPAARIQLQAQANPEAIRRVFCSEEYAMDIVDHCAKAGFVETMHKVGAEFWSNKFSESSVAKRVKAEAEEVVAQEKKKMIASFREDILHSLKVVVAGMNKNFFPIGNPLKDQLFTNMVTVGLPQQTAETVIEKAFAEGAAEYFNTLFDKATEFSALTKEARAEISKAIAASGTLEPSSLESAEPATLSERLAQASVAPATASGFKVAAQLSVDANDYKAQLKNAWRPKV